MIGIVIVAHGALAPAYVAAMEHVVGKQPGVQAVAIAPEDSPENSAKLLKSVIAEVNAGDGVMVLSDMFGGTPSNLAMTLIEPGHIELVAGVNLPMLIKLASIRHSMPLAEAALEIQETGRKYINVASNLLAQRQKERN